MDTQQNFIFEKSNWGDSIEYTLANYSELVEISNKKTIEVGLRRFIKQKNGILHEKQLFHFYNEKLFMISLNFYDLDEMSKEILENKFVEKYGTTKFLSQDLLIDFSITEKFSKELQSYEVECLYANPKMLEKFTIETAKKRTDDIRF